MLLAKEQEHVKKIRQLGSLPAEAFDKYVRDPMRDVSEGNVALIIRTAQYLSSAG